MPCLLCLSKIHPELCGAEARASRLPALYSGASVDKATCGLCYAVMFDPVCSLIELITTRFKSRSRLEVEVLILRHQLGILPRQAPKRLTLSGLNWLVFVELDPQQRRSLARLPVHLISVSA